MHIPRTIIAAWVLASASVANPTAAHAEPVEDLARPSRDGLSAAAESQAFFLQGMVPRGPTQTDRRWQVESRDLRGYVESLSWSPDGKRLAVAESHGIVKIYDAKSWELAGVLYCPERQVAGVAYSPDGRYIATTGADTTLRIWTSSGRPVASARVSFGLLQRIAWSPDSRRVATVDGYRKVTIWDLQAKPRIRLLGHRNTVMSIAWHPGGVRFVSASLDGDVRTWQLDKLVPKRRGPIPPGPRRPDQVMETDRPFTRAMYDSPRRSLNWNLDGTTLVMVDREGVVHMLPDGAAPTSIKGRPVCRTAAWSPDGTTLAVLRGGTVELLDGKGRVVGQRLTGPKSIHLMRWCPDNHQLAVVSGSQVHILTRDGQSTRVLQGRDSNVLHRPVRWSADGTAFTSAIREPRMRIWNADGSGQRTAWPVPGKEVWGVSWDPTGKWLATMAFGDRAVRFWQPDGKPGPVIQRGAQWIAWSPEGANLAAVGGGGEYRFIDRTGKVHSTIQVTGRASQRFAWSPRSDWLAVAPRSGKTALRLLRPDDGKPARVLEGEAENVTGIAWHPLQSQVATIDRDGTVRVWSCGAEGKASRLHQHDQQGAAVAWSPDGRVLASASDDIQLFDEQGKPTVRIEPGYRALCTNLFWSDDSKWLAQQNHTHSVRLWTAGGRSGPILYGNDLAPESASWSPNGRWIAAATNRGTHIVWDARAGLTQSVAFDLPNGDWAVVDADRQLRSNNPAAFHRLFAFVQQQPDGTTVVLAP